MRSSCADERPSLRLSLRCAEAPLRVCWLVSRDGTLSVTDTHDAGTELTAGIKPLVVIDVWEHAYYIDRKNLRPAYVDAVVDELLNWDFAAENFARDTTWTYPA